MRVIAFGCSYTYGHGLPDCVTPPTGPGMSPSNYAWPSIVAKELNAKCINKSSPGSSNKKIWHNIVNFKFKKDDIIFIMWTTPDRSCTLNKFSDIDIGIWKDSSRFYYENYYSHYDALMMSKLFVSNANFLLNNKGLTVYNLTTTKQSSIFKLDKIINHLPVYIGNLKRQFPLALDNSHPGLECHNETAKQIIKKIDHNLKQELSFLDRLRLMVKNEG